MDIKKLKKEIKKIRNNDNTKVILSIGCNTMLINKILQAEYSVLELNNIKIYEEVYYSFFNLKEEIILINLNTNLIDKLYEINKIIKPDILLINSFDDHFKRIKMILYKYIIKGLKKLKNKVLIINNDDEYLRKIYLNNLDIYRVGNDSKNDLHYNNKLFYNNKEFKIKNISHETMISIVVGMLFGYNIEDIIKKID